MADLRRLSQEDQNTLIIVLVTSIVGGLFATLLIRWLWKLVFHYDKEPTIDEDQELGLPPLPISRGASAYVDRGYRHSSVASALTMRTRSAFSQKSFRSKRSRRSSRRSRDYGNPQDPTTPGTVRSVQFHPSHTDVPFRPPNQWRLEEDDDDEEDYSDYESENGRDDSAPSNAAANTAWTPDLAHLAQINGYGPIYPNAYVNGAAAQGFPLEPMQERRNSSVNRTGSTPTLFGINLKNLLGGRRNSNNTDGAGSQAPGSQGPLTPGRRDSGVNRTGSTPRFFGFSFKIGGRRNSSNTGGSFRRTSSFLSGSSFRRAPSNRDAVERPSPAIERTPSTRILGFSVKNLFGGPSAPARRASQSRQEQSPPQYVVAHSSFMQPGHLPQHPQLHTPPSPQPRNQLPFTPQGSFHPQGSFRVEPGAWHGYGPPPDLGASLATPQHMSSLPTPSAAYLHGSAFNSTVGRNNFTSSFRQTTEQQQGIFVGQDGNIKFVNTPASVPAPLSPAARFEPPADYHNQHVSPPAGVSPPSGSVPASRAHAIARSHAPPAIQVPGAMRTGSDPPPTSARIFGVSLRGLGFHQ